MSVLVSKNTRMKYLKDMPKNKVIYHFENVDIASRAG